MRFSCLGLLHLQLMYTYEVHVFRMYTAGMTTYLVLRILGLGRYMFLWWPMLVQIYRFGYMTVPNGPAI
ncbi:hypothetical protein M6B38_116765 [Iris pallida]|uniref:Uncharacterized protein n=1 Tax=Iris pallida TaxID=29817 RepID=A0AAX6HW66_IRIPA|nr:hypothetical protein M6B38_289760 [Iris pallida]KAJ6848162.1 hypothetical protein M6B38_116765 [Iris pallida]